MGKLHCSLWGHHLWAHRRPPEPKSFRAEPRHLVGVLWAFLKWNPPLPLLPVHQIKSACQGLSVSMNGGRINDKCSLPSQLAPSHPARKRLNYFNLIAHVSQKSHLSPRFPLGHCCSFFTFYLRFTLVGLLQHFMINIWIIQKYTKWIPDHLQDPFALDTELRSVIVSGISLNPHPRLTLKFAICKAFKNTPTLNANSMHTRRSKARSIIV